MGDFKKTYFGQYSKVPVIQSYDSKFWNDYETPVIMKEFGTIDSINVAETEPHLIAVTSGFKVEVFNPQVLSVVNTIAHFKTKTHGAIFRNDGQLIASGCANGEIKLFDYNRKQQLRGFQGHSSAVKKVTFLPGTVDIASFSMDHTVRRWDIPTETCMQVYREHEGAVCAGVSNPCSGSFLSGSHDKTVKMWDTRLKESVLTLNHGFMVESVIYFNNGSCCAIAGGTKLQLYDLVANKSIKTFSAHHQTITCLTLADNGTRLLSGSIDKQIKVYSLSSYQSVKNVHMEYPGEILSIGSTPSSSTLVLGMTHNGSGILSFQKKPEIQTTRKSHVKRVRIDDERRGKQMKTKKNLDDPLRETKYDYYLRRFEVTKALEAVLRVKEQPEKVVAVFFEITRRKALVAVLEGQTFEGLKKIVRFIIRYIGNLDYTRMLNHVAKTLIKLYKQQIVSDVEYKNLFLKLKKKISEQIEIIKLHGELGNVVQLAVQFHKSKQIEERLNLSATDKTNENLTTLINPNVLINVL